MPELKLHMLYNLVSNFEFIITLIQTMCLQLIKVKNKKNSMKYFRTIM